MQTPLLIMETIRPLFSHTPWLYVFHAAPTHRKYLKRANAVWDIPITDVACGAGPETCGEDENHNGWAKTREE